VRRDGRYGRIRFRQLRHRPPTRPPVLERIFGRVNPR
jgi:hypothetical protein